MNRSSTVFKGAELFIFQGRIIGEIYDAARRIDDDPDWGYFSYLADSGGEQSDTKEDAQLALVDTHCELLRTLKKKLADVEKELKDWV